MKWLTGSGSDPDIADLAVENLGGHDGEGIVGQLLPLLLGRVGPVFVVGAVLNLRQYNLYTKRLLEKIEDEFGELFLVVAA